MRLAIVATPAISSDQRPVPGALDGDVVRARLPLPDTSFEVVDLDPEQDLAEQLERLFDERRPGPSDLVLFYASSAVALSNAGELFVCLDPENPDVGDSLHDITAVFEEHMHGPVLFVLELRHVPHPDDPFRSATIVAAAKGAIRAPVTGIEALIAARLTPMEVEDHTSPFTRALIAALEEADPDKGLLAEVVYEQIVDSEILLGVVPCFSHLRGRASFELLPIPEGACAIVPVPAVVEAEGAAEPAPDAEAEDETEAEDEAEAEAEDEAEAAAEPAAEAEAVEEEIAVEATPEPVAAAEPEPVAQPAPEPVATVAPMAPARRSSPRAAAAEPVASDYSYATSVDLPEARSFRRIEPDLPKIIIDVPKSPSAPPPAPDRPLDGAVAAFDAEQVPETPRPAPVKHHIEAGDALVTAGDAEGALGEFRKALALLAPADALDRASIFVRIASVKAKQDKRREAISNLDKALQILPGYRPALEELIELNVAERDLRAAAAAEESLLATLFDPNERFGRLVAFAERWETSADTGRARLLLTRALELRPDDIELLIKLRPLCEAAGETDRSLAMLRRIAELTQHPRARALRYFELGERTLKEKPGAEDAALELFDLALDSDPTMLKPLEIVARLLAERQEWSQLERAYEKMIARVQVAPDAQIKREVTFELYRQLGLLRRDHLEDFALSLEAFERSIAIKQDVTTRLIAADLAKRIGNSDRAIVHLQAVARLDPSRVATFHDLFEEFQRQRRPDQAYCASCVTVFVGAAEARERFIFNEHRPARVPKLVNALDASAWDLLTPEDADPNLAAILQAITPAAIHARLSQLAAQGKLTQLDPAGRHDVQTSTVSIARSFGWASHFLGVPAPAVHVRDDAEIGLLAVVAEEPTVVAGGAVLRGRSLPDLAFLSGRHLAYHVGSHRLLLFFASLEDLSACLLAALRIARPTLPIPPKMQESALALAALMKPKLPADTLAELERAVAHLNASGRPADLSRWAADVERCATRAGYVLTGDLEVAVNVMKNEPRGVLSVEDRIADLLGFSVSEAHHQLRTALGVAIEP
jgi:tetratricopeptide (TPR) repeat protein